MAEHSNSPSNSAVAQNSNNVQNSPFSLPNAHRYELNWIIYSDHNTSRAYTSTADLIKIEKNALVVQQATYMLHANAVFSSIFTAEEKRYDRYSNTQGPFAPMPDALNSLLLLLLLPCMISQPARRFSAADLGLGIIIIFLSCVLPSPSSVPCTHASLLLFIMISNYLNHVRSSSSSSSSSSFFASPNGWSEIKAVPSSSGFK